MSDETLPTSYTHATYAEWLHLVAERAGLADLLNWSTVEKSYNPIITEVVDALGVTSVQNVEESRLPALRAVGKAKLYAAIEEGLVTLMDVSSQGESIRYGQIVQNVARLRLRAEQDALRFGIDLLPPPLPMPPATVQDVVRPEDAYSAPVEGTRRTRKTTEPEA